MAVVTTSSVQMLKVKFDDDIRRVQVEFPNGGTAADKLSALRSAVGACFGKAVADSLVLKYKDDDGDMCMLIEATVEDMLQLANEGPLYLFASVADDYKLVSAESREAVGGQGATQDCDEIVMEELPIRTEEDSQDESTFGRSDERGRLVAPLLAMGFDERDAITAIEKAKGDAEVAVAILLKERQPRRSLIGRLFSQFTNTPIVSEQPATLQEDSITTIHDPVQLEDSGVFEAKDGDRRNQERETEQIESSETLEHVSDQLEHVSMNTEEHVREEIVSQTSGENESLVAPLLAMGFEESDAIIAIEKAKGDVEVAVAILLKLEQPRRSLIGSFFSRFSDGPSVSEQPVAFQEDNVEAMQDPIELEDSAVPGVAEDRSLHNVDSLLTEEMTDTLQHLEHETDHMESSVALAMETEARSSSEDRVVEEGTGFHNSEHTSIGIDSEDMSRSAPASSMSATPVDQMRVLASCFLKAVRTRQFIPESMSSAGADETSLDRVQRSVSDSLSVVRSQMQRLRVTMDSASVAHQQGSA